MKYILLLLLCSAQAQAAGVAQSPTKNEPLLLAPGFILVTSASAPAGFGFDKAKGQTGCASEGAGDAARAALEPPWLKRLPDNQICAYLRAAWSPVGAVLAPFAAAEGAVAAGHARMPSDSLSQSEADLKKAMSSMADQRHLRGWILKSINETCPGRAVSAELLSRDGQRSPEVSAVLETQVQTVWLERTGHSDCSFALRLTGQARLLRPGDGLVLQRHPFDFHTGTDLFLDWAAAGVFEDVAETAYRTLAGQLARQVIPSVTDTPLLLEPNKAAARSQRSARMAAALSPSQLQFVSYPALEIGPIAVYPVTPPFPIALQRPLSKDEAISQATAGLDWSLDGLQDSPNLLVQLSACTVALPVGLWQQTVGALRGLSADKLAAAESRLTAAAQKSVPADLAQLVAERLAPGTAQEVVLLQQPPSSSIPGEPMIFPYVAAAAPRSNQEVFTALDSRSPRHPRQPRSPSVALEIQVLSAALRGKEGVNPPLSLLIEAQANLRRTSDALELYSCPVTYRSRPHKFTKWAAHDARLFREELEEASRQLSDAVADRLLTRGLVAPENGSGTLAASAPD